MDVFEAFNLLVESSSLRSDLLKEAITILKATLDEHVLKNVCNCKIFMTLKEFLELPLGIKGKIAIWPAEYKRLDEKFDAIEHYPNVDDPGLDEHLDSKILQIFADSDGILNFVLY